MPLVHILVFHEIFKCVISPQYQSYLFRECSWLVIEVTLWTFHSGNLTQTRGARIKSKRFLCVGWASYRSNSPFRGCLYNKDTISKESLYQRSVEPVHLRMQQYWPPRYNRSLPTAEERQGRHLPRIRPAMCTEAERSWWTPLCLPPRWRKDQVSALTEVSARHAAVHPKVPDENCVTATVLVIGNLIPIWQINMSLWHHWEYTSS